MRDEDPLPFIIAIVALVFVLLISISQCAKCEESYCEKGKPMMLRGACICVERPKEAP